MPPPAQVPARSRRTADSPVPVQQGAGLPLRQPGKPGARAVVARAGDLAGAGSSVGDEHRPARTAREKARRHPGSTRVPVDRLQDEVLADGTAATRTKTSTLGLHQSPAPGARRGPAPRCQRPGSPRRRQRARRTSATSASPPGAPCGPVRPAAAGTSVTSTLLAADDLGLALGRALAPPTADGSKRVRSDKPRSFDSALRTSARAFTRLCPRRCTALPTAPLTQPIVTGSAVPPTLAARLCCPVPKAGGPSERDIGRITRPERGRSLSCFGCCRSVPEASSWR